MESKSWEEIVSKIKNLQLKEDFDLIVSIGRGGIIPGLLLAKEKNLEFGVLWLKFRDEDNETLFEEPKFVKKTNFKSKNKNILLVDNVSRTGKTVKKAKEILEDSNLVKTLVVNGKGDYSLYEEDCFEFPWD